MKSYVALKCGSALLKKILIILKSDFIVLRNLLVPKEAKEGAHVLGECPYFPRKWLRILEHY